MAGDAAALRLRYEAVLARGAAHPERALEALAELRQQILLEGIPNDNLEDRGAGSLRARIWKILLQVNSVDAAYYTSLIAKGPCAKDYYTKIRNDTPRTFDKEYQKIISEDKIIRVLTAFAHSVSTDTSSKISQYNQGMNAICGMFLYVMPEIDAFYCFSNFIKLFCPTYWTKTIDGAHAGNALLERCLQRVDSDLHQYFRKRGEAMKMSTRESLSVFSLAALLSFSSNLPPIEETLLLWDFLLAFGLHLNVICFLAQLVLARDQLLNSQKPPERFIRELRLDSRQVLSMSAQLIRELPDDLYKLLVEHPTQSDVCAKLQS